MSSCKYDHSFFISSRRLKEEGWINFKQALIVRNMRKKNEEKKANFMRKKNYFKLTNTFERLQVFIFFFWCFRREILVPQSFQQGFAEYYLIVLCCKAVVRIIDWTDKLDCIYRHYILYVWVFFCFCFFVLLCKLNGIVSVMYASWYWCDCFLYLCLLSRITPSRQYKLASIMPYFFLLLAWVTKQYAIYSFYLSVPIVFITDAC